MRTRGRPQKYTKLLSQLDEHTLYTPATIASFALSHGFIKNSNVKLAKQRIRIAMGRRSNNHQFPDEGDGMVVLKGQAPCPAWFGWRWQERS